MEAQLKFGEDTFSGFHIPKALELVPVRHVGVQFAIGADKGTLIPTMSLRLQGPEASVNVVAATIGYLGQLPWVEKTRMDNALSCHFAIQFTQISDPELGQVDARLFAKNILDRSPEMRPMLKLPLDETRSAITLIDSFDAWDRQAVAQGAH